MFLFGSHARGDATPTSDVDLRIVTLAAPRVRYRTWFVGERHVSVGAGSVDHRRSRMQEPMEWALGLPTSVPAIWLWKTAAAVAAFGDPPVMTSPPAPPELEDFVEYAAKALRAPDAVPLRLAAQGVGRQAIPLLLDLNVPEPVGTPAGAIAAARAFRIAPDRWPDDLLTMLGLAPAEDGAVRAAVERAGFGILRLLRERGSRVGDAQPDVTRYLHDGTFERHLDRSRCYFEIP